MHYCKSDITLLSINFQFEKATPENMAKFLGNHLQCSSFLTKVVSWRSK